MEAYLPSDLECDHCVLQWRYHCANSWGSDETGSGLGKGYQEEFYGCADISVKNKNVKPTQAPSTKDQLAHKNFELPTVVIVVFTLCSSQYFKTLT